MSNQEKPPRSFWSYVLGLTPEDLSKDSSIVKADNQDPNIIPLRKDKELGSSGTEVNSGYPAEDYLWELRGTRRADLYDKMRRGDPQVTMVLTAIKSPILAATWEIEPGCVEGETVTEEAKQDAELVRHILFNDLDAPFEEKTEEALTLVDFGHAVFEITDKVVRNHPKFGTYNGIASLGWRSPRTIERWNLDKDTGKLTSITQQADGDLSRYVDIPAHFLLVMTLKKEGSNYEGVSVLRPCYGPWKRKGVYLKLNAIGIEKFAVPAPLAEIPVDKINSPEAANLKAALESFTSHESNFIMYPAGWKVELNSNTYDPEKVEKSVDSEDRRMAKSIMANFLELGMTSGGAFSLSNDLSDFFLSGLQHTAGKISGAFNQQLIPRIVKLNRGPRSVYPKLKVSGITDKAGKELAEMLVALGGGKWLTPEDSDESHLRRRMGLPARTGEGTREVVSVTLNQQAPVGTVQTTPVPGAGGEIPTQKAADTALNGAQVASLVEIVSKVAMGLLPRDSAISIIKTAFLVTDAQAAEILASAGDGFKIVDPNLAARSLSERIRLAERRRLGGLNG